MIFTVIAFFICILLGYGYFIEPNFLDIEKVKIKLNNGESGLSGKRFAHISDLHFNKHTKEKWVEKIFKKIEKLKPDMVFLTGDIVSDTFGVKSSIILVEKLTKLFPVYIVFGNWDKWVLRGKLEEYKKDLENAGADVLINEERQVNVGGYNLNIIGVDDPFSTKKTTINLDEIAGRIENKQNSCEILLAHSPDIAIDAAKHEIDLVLVGHTHGGQVYIPFITNFMIPVRREAKHFVAGYYKIKNTSLYVNRGIGLSTFPFRFLITPEIALLKIE